MAAPKTVAEYLATQPPDQRRVLRRLRAIVRENVRGTTGSMSYGLPTFKRDGEPLVYFGGWAKHCSVYGLPTTGVPAKYSGSKGTIRLAIGEPLPEAMLVRLLKKRLKTIRPPREPRRPGELDGAGSAQKSRRPSNDAAACGRVSSYRAMR